MRMLLVSVLVPLAACISMGATGNRIQTDHLSRMEVGLSSKEEVRSLLGEPNGVGGSRLSGESSIRDVWFYQHVVFEIPVKQETLLIFFENDRYQGHFWFSSLAGMEDIGGLALR